MGKLLILSLIIIGAFWLGRLSVRSKNQETTKNPSLDESTIIDVEIEDESKKK